MADDKVSIVFEALVGSSTKSTFNALTQGFQKFAKGLRASAIELNKMQQTQAAEALGHVSLAVNKLALDFGKMGTGTKKTVTNLGKLEEAFAHLTKIEGETGKAAKEALASFKAGTTTYKNTTKALSALNIQQKITAQTQKYVAEGSKLVALRWKNLIPLIINGKKSFDGAVTATNNFGTALYKMSNTIDLGNGHLKTFYDRMAHSTIIDAEKAKSIKLVGSAYQILTKEGYAAFNLTKKNAAILHEYAQGTATLAQKLKLQAKATADEAKATAKAALEHKKFVNQARILARDFKSLTHATDLTTAAQQRLKIKIIDLVRSVKKGDVNFQNARSKMKAYGDEMRRITPVAGLFQRAIERLGKSFKTYSSYMASSRLLMGLADSFAVGTQAILEHDQALHDLKAIMNATNTDVALLDKTLLDVASATKFSIGEVAGAMRRFGQAGFTASESMAGMQDIASLATGTLEGLEETVNLVTAAVRVFQLGMDQTGMVADVFANAVNKSRLTLHKLNISFNYVGPLAKAAGISLKDTTASMMLLANAGVRASTSATGFRRVLGGLMNPSTALSAAIKKAGYELDDFNPLMTEFSDIVQRLPDVIGNAGDAIKMFGLRGSAVVSAFATQGSTEFDRLRGSLDTVGAASRMAEEQMKGLQNMLKNVKDRFGILATTLTKGGLLTIFRGLVKAIQGLLFVFNKLAGSTIGKVLVQTGLLVMAFILLSSVIGQVIRLKLVGWFAKGLLASINFTVGLLAQDAATKKLALSHTVLRGSLKLLALAFKQAAVAAWALIVTPVGLAISAIAVVLGTLTYKFSQYKKELKEIQEKQTVFANSLNVTTGALTKYLQAVEKHGTGSAKAADAAKTLYKSAEALGKKHEKLKEIVNKFTEAIDKNTGSVTVSTSKLKGYKKILKAEYETALLQATAATMKLYAAQQKQRQVWVDIKNTLKEAGRFLLIITGIMKLFKAAGDKSIPSLQRLGKILDALFNTGTVFSTAIVYWQKEFSNFGTAAEKTGDSLLDTRIALEKLKKEAKSGKNQLATDTLHTLNTNVKALSASFYEGKDAAKVSGDEIAEYVKKLKASGEIDDITLLAVADAFELIGEKARAAASSIEGQFKRQITNLQKELRALSKDSSFMDQSTIINKYLDKLQKAIIARTTALKNEYEIELQTYGDTIKQKEEIDEKYYQKLTELVRASEASYNQIATDRKNALIKAYGAELSNLGNYFDTKKTLEQMAHTNTLGYAQKDSAAKLKILKNNAFYEVDMANHLWQLKKDGYNTGLAIANEHKNRIIAISQERYVAETQAVQILTEKSAERSKKLVELEKTNLSTKISAIKENMSAYKTYIADAMSLEESLSQKIKNSIADRKAFREGVDATIRNLKYKTMSDEAVLEAKKTRAIELEDKARSAYLSGDYKKSQKYIKQGITAWKEYASAVDKNKMSTMEYEDTLGKVINNIDDLGTAYDDAGIAAEASAQQQKDEVGATLADLNLSLSALQTTLKDTVIDMGTLGDAIHMQQAIAVMEQLSGWLKELEDLPTMELNIETDQRSTLSVLEDMVKEWAKLDSKTITLKVKQKAAGGLIVPKDHKVGGIVGLNNGGGVGAFFKKLTSPYITKGSGTKDDVPAMLTKKEYVLSAPAVERAGLPFLNALNFGTSSLSSLLSNAADSFSTMFTGTPAVPAFASGGYVAGENNLNNLQLQNFGNLTLDIAGKKINTIVNKDVISELNEHLTKLKRFGT